MPPLATVESDSEGEDMPDLLEGSHPMEEGTKTRPVGLVGGIVERWGDAVAVPLPPRAPAHRTGFPEVRKRKGADVAQKVSKGVVLN